MMILCCQGFLRMLQDGSGSVLGFPQLLSGMVQQTFWRFPELFPSFSFIFYLFLTLWFCVCVCVCSPGDAGRHWSSGLGMDGFPSFPHPMFMSIYVNDMSTGVFFAHHIAIRIPFRWLAAAVRFPGLLYVHALLLQAWSGISTFHDHLGSDRRNCVITTPLRTLFRGGPYQN